MVNVLFVCYYKLWCLLIARDLIAGFASLKFVFDRFDEFLVWVRLG